MLVYYDNVGKMWLDRLFCFVIELCMNDLLKILLVIVFLIVIVWNLGVGLYYLLVDCG